MYNGCSPEVINKYREKIKYEEQSISSIANEHTLYFIAPKELLNGLYQDAESMEISVKIPFHIERKTPNGKSKMISEFDPLKAIVEFSPTKNGLDYNWYSGDLTVDEINYLFDIYKRWVKEKCSYVWN